MNVKIVSIVMTIFMLVMCVLAMTTMSLVNMKLEQDQVLERASSSVLSTDGEIKDTDGISVRGSALISSIVGTAAIDSRIPNSKDKVYSYKEIDGTYQTRYIFDFGGDTSNNSIISKIQPTEWYTLTYTFDDTNNSARVKIEKGVGS